MKEEMFRNKCTFCTKQIEFGTGWSRINSDSSQLNFCSSKCWNNFRLGRSSKKVGWVKKVKKNEQTSSQE